MDKKRIEAMLNDDNYKYRKKTWKWAKGHAESLMNCKGERKLKYVNLGRLKQWLGV